MFKNPNYVYGPQEVLVPGNLNFSDFILRRLWFYKDKVSLISGETHESITFGEIAQQALNLAVSLYRMGIGKGQTVGILSENRQEYCGAIVGVISTGAVLTAFNVGYSKGELKHVLSISKPKCVICSPAAFKINEKTLRATDYIKNIIIFGNERYNNTLLYNELAITVNNVNLEEFQVADVRGQTDTLLILYSSGTTGLPKGVMLTHLNLLTACCLPATYDPSLSTLTITPWYHSLGLVGMLKAWTVGRTDVYLPKFSVDLFLKTIERYKVIQITVVPPVLVAICKSTSQYDLSSIQTIYSGAAPLHKDTIADVVKKFPNVKTVFQGYGATEATFTIARLNNEDPDHVKPGSVGKPMAGVIMKIVDPETRQPLGPNQQGEICAKGELFMKGYVGRNRSEDFDDEGFYKTGDVGYYDENRFFFITDRLKELIKYKGYQVPPAEIEAVLLQHGAIHDAAVIGIEHKEAGEVPLAFVVPQPGKTLSENEVKAFVAERLSNPKHLRGGVRFVDQIPKSPSGKILRKELRKLVKKTMSKL